MFEWTSLGFLLLLLFTIIYLLSQSWATHSIYS